MRLMFGPNQKDTWDKNMSTLRRVVRAHPITSACFVIALLALLWFGISFLSGALYFNDPKHRNQAIEPWMTPRYVSRSWRIPPEKLNPILELEKRDGEGRPPTMGQIATDLNLTIDELEALIAQTSQELQKSRQERKNND